MAKIELTCTLPGSLHGYILKIIIIILINVTQIHL